MQRSATLVGIAVLLLAACGGSATLTKTQYDAKVNHLCLALVDQFHKLQRITTGDGHYYLSTIVHIESQFDDGLAALQPPASIASAALAYQKANERDLADEEAALRAFNAGDRRMLRWEFSKANRAAVAADALAKKFGETGCSTR